MYTRDSVSTQGGLTVSRETSLARGERLAKAREVAGLRQLDLAAELVAAGLVKGKPRAQTVSEWELGEKEPGLDQLTWLRERLGFDWDEFFTGREPKKEAEAYRRIRKIVAAAEGITLPVASAEAEADVIEAGIDDSDGGDASQKGAS